MMKLSTPLILFLSFVIQNFVLIKFNHGGFLKRETDFSNYLSQYFLYRVCSTDNFLLPIFFRISKVLSVLHHSSVGRVQSKRCYFIFTYTFLTFFLLLFFIKISVFLSFSFLFFDKVSNFHNRISISQKPEKVVRNCQWNCV